MLKAVVGIALLAFGTLASAEEFILRFEHGSYQKEDRPGGELESFAEQLQLVKSKGAVKELLEIPIRTGERFYAKAKFGRTEVQIRGELKAPDATGKHMIKIRTRVTDFTEELLSQLDGKVVEASSSMGAESSLYITLEEPLWVGGIGRSPEPKAIATPAPELEHNVFFVTIEPPKYVD